MLGMWKFLIILIPYTIVFVLDTMGWRYALKDLTPDLKFLGLFAARMAGESINCLTPSAYLGGEPLKAYLLKTYNVSTIDGMASVVISRTIMTLAQVVFVLIGVALAFSRLKELDDTIAEFYSTNRRGFYLCFLFYFLGWLAGMLEVYLILNFLGVPIDLTSAFIIEALFTVARSASSFIPGSLGGQEGGVLLVFLALSLTAQVSMSFCIIRRIREALWVGAGLVVLAKWQA